MDASGRVRTVPPPWTAALVALAAAWTVAAGLLRSHHAATPRLPGSVGSFGSLLFVLVAGLLLLHLVDRRAGADLLDPPGRGRGVRLAHVAPLLAALAAEKWLSTDLLARAFDWIDDTGFRPGSADALFRLWTGLALLGTGLALLPVFRQVHPRLRAFTGRARVRQAAVNVLCGLAVVYLFLVALAVPTRSTWTTSSGPLALVTVAQLVRSAAEELFYRGLVQSALVRLLVQGGLPDRRAVRLVAVGVVSLAFTLEHLAGTPPRALVYVFLVSCLLGLLMEVARNLPVVMAAHALLNLFAIGALPLPVAPSGLPLVQPNVVGLVLLVLLFGGVAVSHRGR